MKNNPTSAARIGTMLMAAWTTTIAGAGLTGCSTPEPPTSEEKIQASAENLRATLECAVEDAGKRQQMLALADQAMAELQTGAEELAALRREQERLYADYMATRDDFEELGNRMQAVRRKQVAQIIAARQALASLATDDEWNIIAGRDLALLNH